MKGLGKLDENWMRTWFMHALGVAFVEEWLIGRIVHGKHSWMLEEERLL